MIFLFPFLTSFCLGILLFQLLDRDKEQDDLGLRLILSWGLGLGISAHITFYSFVVFNRLRPDFIIVTHLFLLGLLLVLGIVFHRKINLGLFSRRRSDISGVIGLAFLAICCYPLWAFAHLYPFGGWDAWSTWNFKAKFLFLSGTQWKEMFSPLLWRSSPHYPLFLPLVNVWGWIFSKSPVYTVPLGVSILYSYLTLGLLFAALKQTTRIWVAFLVTLLPLSIPLFCILSTSQYSDIVLSYYLLGSFVCLHRAEERNSRSMALLCGLFLGFLSFTKAAGIIICGILTLLITFYFIRKKQKNPFGMKFLRNFFAGLVAGIIPTVIFTLLYSPGNQTFLNGLVSPSQPSDITRLKTILAFGGLELISPKWGGIWILLLMGFILSQGRCFQKSLGLFLPFIIFFGLVVGLYYFVNTWWEIRWFLKVSLSRILLVVLPVSLYWVVSCLWKKKKDGQSLC